MKKRLLALGLSALMALSLTACSSGGDQSSKKVQLKMSVTISDTSTWGQAAKKFADEVKEKTNGRIEIQVVANEQLSGGNQAKGVEQLSTGATDISMLIRKKNIIININISIKPSSFFIFFNILFFR